MNPLVSVIIPVYNGERFIKQTINSVMAQSYPELDIIVSNDGSTDGTSAILERYGGRQFRAINEENAGEATAVNRGYKEAKGKYVIVLNADDLLAPNAVTQLVEFMEYHSRIIVAYPDFDVIDAEGKIIEHKRTREYDYTYMVSHHWCFPSVGTIIRREVLEKSGLRNPAYKYVGDFEHFLRIGKHGDFCRIPKTLAYWRRWGAQASSKSGQAMAAEHIRLIADYYENYSLPKSILKKKSQAICWSYIVGALRTHGSYRIVYLLTGITYYPLEIFNAKNYWYLLHINKFSKGGTQNG